MRGEQAEMRNLQEVKIRRGTRPLCRRIHHLEMSGPNDEKGERYSCDAPGCNMHWRPQSGYFEQNLPSPVIEQWQDLIDCPRFGHGHMFIAAVDGRNGVEIWQCCVEGCAQRFERPIEGGYSETPHLH